MSDSIKIQVVTARTGGQEEETEEWSIKEEMGGHLDISRWLVSDQYSSYLFSFNSLDLGA